MKDAQYIAASILNELGEKPCSTTFIEAGSTSKAYRIVSNRSDYVLRIASPNAGKLASFESDFQLRSALSKQGLAVAKPIATNQSFQLGIQAKWALDEYRMGNSPARGEITSRVSRQLGSVLRTLHELPVSGYGKLENSRDGFAGVAQTPESGFLTRFESPWPFSHRALDKHPAIRKCPSLNAKLRAFESALFALIRESEGVVAHSDLHEGQLLVFEGQLTALLDFNDVVVSAKEMDFGSYLYFHGHECLCHLLDGYSDDADEISQLQQRAELASILVALHHGNRGVILGRPHRIAAACHFLETIL